jgi:hypothetical protein
MPLMDVKLTVRICPWLARSVVRFYEIPAV